MIVKFELYNFRTLELTQTDFLEAQKLFCNTFNRRSFIDFIIDFDGNVAFIEILG